MPRSLDYPEGHGHRLELRNRAMQPYSRAHQEKNRTCAFLFHGLGIKKSRQGQSTCLYHLKLARLLLLCQARIVAEQRPFTAGERGVGNSISLSRCAVYAGHGDAWPGSSALGPPKTRVPFSQVHQVTRWAAAALGQPSCGN